MNKLQNFIASENGTLLTLISSFKKDLSHKTIKNLIKNRMVKVNDKVITNHNYLVNNLDKIELSYTKKVIPDYKLEILYEDKYLIAVNKPSGLLSISNDSEKIVTAYRMVSNYVKTNNKKKYIFVVHRLDQDTSGVLLFSKDKNIRDTLQNNWNTFVKKRGYLAIVSGKMKGSGTYRSYLLENHQQFVYSSSNKQGKYAITNYKVINNNHHYSLVQVFLDTGRRNQIRVHFSEHGYPLVGDKKYGCKENPIKRLCLHANILEFTHPVTKKIIHLESPYPEEFNSLISLK